MNIAFVDLKKNYETIQTEIQEEFRSLFDHCDFINGKKVQMFENNFANYLNLKHFIGCANGTDALEIAIQCLDLKPEDEVIIPGNTYIATALGVVNNNVKLVLCDIVKETHMMDMAILKQKITEKTKAIIVVHLFGLMPDMDILMEICKTNHIRLIEDCAQAHGALWRNQKAGSFGDLACFSFYPGKNLGAYGDGGGIGTNNDIYNDKIRKIINIGCKQKYHHEIIGRNSRLDTLQASFLNVKLKYLDSWNQKRRKNATLYSTLLQEVGDICLPIFSEECVPVFHLYVIRTKYRDELQKYLGSKNIQCLIHYPISIGETEAMSSFQFVDLKNCVDNSKEILSLPMYPELDSNEIEYICDNIKQYFIENNLVKIVQNINVNKPGTLYYNNSFIFDTKRFFYVDFNENNAIINGSIRGFHANVNFNEFIVIMEGSIRIKLINQDLKEEIKIVKKQETFFISTMKWIEYESMDTNTILFCLVDKQLSESKSIYDFQEFISYRHL